MSWNMSMCMSMCLCVSVCGLQAVREWRTFRFSSKTCWRREWNSVQRIPKITCQRGKSTCGTGSRVGEGRCFGNYAVCHSLYCGLLWRKMCSVVGKIKHRNVQNNVAIILKWFNIDCRIWCRWWMQRARRLICQRWFDNLTCNQFDTCFSLNN